MVLALLACFGVLSLFVAAPPLAASLLSIPFFILLTNLSLHDLRTFEIPDSQNLAIASLGMIATALIALACPHWVVRGQC
jgi:prepilin signal peptidase PulO-like enzyme (type II secretory pathway)